jgi:hypothetical protein
MIRKLNSASIIDKMKGKQKDHLLGFLFVLVSGLFQDWNSSEASTTRRSKDRIFCLPSPLHDNGAQSSFQNTSNYYLDDEQSPEQEFSTM